MQVDDITRERYKTQAPQLLTSIEQEDTLWIMRKDPSTSMCVKLEGGRCGIQKNHGDAFLGDACHFYPRVTRALGDEVVMTATMSCPEIVRLMLSEATPNDKEPAEADRLPQSIKNYLPEGMSAEDALAIHQRFLAASEDETASPERIFARIAHVSRKLDALDKNLWLGAVDMLFAQADAALPIPEGNMLDPFNLLHTLCGLIVASKKTPSERLKKTISEMERALEAQLKWDTVEIDATNQSLAAWQGMQILWNEKGARTHARTLRRWLQMQLSLALFPHAGLGETLEERITIIGVRLATIKLALMSACTIYGEILPQEILVRILQSLSRFLDHLGDARFSLLIFAETGWIKEPRMRGLLEM